MNTALNMCCDNLGTSQKEEWQYQDVKYSYLFCLSAQTRRTQTHTDPQIHTHKHPEQQSGAEDGLSTILVFKGTSFLNCFIRIYQWFYMPSDSDPRLFVIG